MERRGLPVACWLTDANIKKTETETEDVRGALVHGCTSMKVYCNTCGGWTAAYALKQHQGSGVGCLPLTLPLLSSLPTNQNILRDKASREL